MSHVNHGVGNGPSVARVGHAARFLAWLITLYQRYVSPYKGWRCAHRVLHGGESCSQYVRRVVLERGPWNAVRSARGRFAECRAARDALLASQATTGDSNSPATTDASAGRHRWWQHLDCCVGCPADACDCGDVPGVDCCP